jgi:hypothetical protein
MIAVVTPHHDPARKHLLDRLRFYMSRQTMQPDLWLIIDEPTKIKPDLTYRVRVGCQRAIEAGATCILIMEDDDWYDPKYIEFMVNAWKQNGKPKIFGIGFTLYCHIFAQKQWFSPHSGRASLMSTLLTPNGLKDYEWCPDTEIWLDMHLWSSIKGKTVEPNKFYSVGIKHGIGLCGGVGHNRSFGKYVNDPNHAELRKHIKDDVAWYKTLRP